MKKIKGIISQVDTGQIWRTGLKTSHTDAPQISLN